MFEPVDFDAFCAERVFELLAGGNGRLAAQAVSGADPLAFRLPDGRAYTFAAEAGDVVVRPGDRTAATVVLLSEEAWSDFVSEARTAKGLHDAGLITFVRGDFGGLARWEPALRAVFSGRPLYDPTRVAGLDLRRAFALQDPEREMRAFLATAGFIRVRRALRAEEIGALAEEAERLVAAARPDDRRTSWATGPDGRPVCRRISYVSLASPRLAVLADDGRLRRLAGLAEVQLVPLRDRLGGVAVVAGPHDPGTGPWHRDCDLGGHPVLCPSLEVAVHLEPASGPVVLAGSHESSGAPSGLGEDPSLPVVTLDAEPGDVTAWFGHLLRTDSAAAQVPVGLAVHVRFATTALVELIGPGQSYDDFLGRLRRP